MDINELGKLVKENEERESIKSLLENKDIIIKEERENYYQSLYNLKTFFNVLNLFEKREPIKIKYRINFDLELKDYMEDFKDTKILNSIYVYKDYIENSENYEYLKNYYCNGKIYSDNYGYIYENIFGYLEIINSPEIQLNKDIISVVSNIKYQSNITNLGNEVKINKKRKLINVENNSIKKNKGTTNGYILFSKMAIPILNNYYKNFGDFYNTENMVINDINYRWNSLNPLLCEAWEQVAEQNIFYF